MNLIDTLPQTYNLLEEDLGPAGPSWPAMAHSWQVVSVSGLGLVLV